MRSFLGISKKCKTQVIKFEATYDQEVGPLSMKEYHVKVIKLVEHYHDFYGITCEAKEGGNKQYIAMAELKVSPSNPNFTLLDDYNSWFWNYR